jgi:diguanylate cyclase (GGDEF)-like protein/PAS domain S-box-containing protein
MTTEGTSDLGGVSVEMTRDDLAVILSVGDNITEVLGWRPEQLIGRPSTEFVHPDDQPGALATWFEMMVAPGDTFTWQGRYRTATGEWKWVECVNKCDLVDPEHPVVFTTMRWATEQVSMAELLRERDQLLSQLSDAMPVGMFQIDTDRSITVTNNRLRSILGHSVATEILQLPIVGDHDVLSSAFDSVLTGEVVDDIELRFARNTPYGAIEERVCLLSMRPLTDQAGGVTGAVGCLSDVTDQVRLRRQLELRANTDELTSCLSRAAILDLLSLTLTRRDNIEGGTALIFVDLCRFKEINDSFGHDAGDHILELASARLRAAVRDIDGVGRLGGDEFLVVCPSVDSPSTALVVAKRILATLTDRIDMSTGFAELGASIGVAWSDGPIDADTLIAQADRAMYDAKRSGSSTVKLFAD